MKYFNANSEGEDKVLLSFNKKILDEIYNQAIYYLNRNSKDNCTISFVFTGKWMEDYDNEISS
jgi:hypothetical protein